MWRCSTASPSSCTFSAVMRAQRKPGCRWRWLRSPSSGTWWDIPVPDSHHQCPTFCLRVLGCCWDVFPRSGVGLSRFSQTAGPLRDPCDHPAHHTEGSVPKPAPSFQLSISSALHFHLLPVLGSCLKGPQYLQPVSGSCFITRSNLKNDPTHLGQQGRGSRYIMGSGKVQPHTSGVMVTTGCLVGGVGDVNHNHP